MANPNDAVREAILKCLYDIHQKARSPKSAAIGIRELQRYLRPLGYKQQEVASNLDYLLQKGWVKEVISPSTYTTPGGTRRLSEKRTYKISDIGIDKLEGASIYQRKPVLSAINITNIKGVTVVGDGNIVNTNYGDLKSILEELRQRILESSTLDDRVKLEAVSDIDSLQSQLQKPSPNKSVVKSLWDGIQSIGKIAGFIDVVSKITMLLGPLISP